MITLPHTLSCDLTQDGTGGHTLPGPQQQCHNEFTPDSVIPHCLSDSF